MATSRLLVQPLDQGHHEAHNVGGTEENVFIEVLDEDVLDFECFFLLVKLEVEDLVSEDVFITHEIF